LPLQAILEEKNITRAAARVSLTQPALSRILARLRQSFEDDLLVRRGSRYELTPRGARLLRELENLLPRLNAALAGREFAPATSEQRFRVTGTDYAAAVIINRMVRSIRPIAPGIRIEIASWSPESYRLVETGNCDLVLGAGASLHLPGGLKMEVLYNEEFVCLISKEHPFRGDRFSLHSYLRQAHAAVLTSETQQTMIDQRLADHGHLRRTAFISPYFLSAPAAIVGTDLVLTIPKRLLAVTPEQRDLRQVLPPFEIGGFPYTMAWHPRHNGDASHVWFREQLREGTRFLEDED
jgi:DNA-binding transcriptional LysR family regulator